MAKLTITQVRNPFDPYKSRVIKEVECGLTVKECIDLLDPCSEGYEYAVSLNGVLFDKGIDFAVIKPVGSLVFCAYPQGDDGSGKNPLRTIAMLAVIIVAAYVSYGVTLYPSIAAYGGTTAAAIGAAAGFAVTMAGNLLINALLPLSTPDMSGASDLSNSSTYGWDVTANPNREGVVWPVIYGTVRITPPIIAKFIEVVDNKQYLNLLFAIADHEITSVDETSIRINENTILSGEVGIAWDIRLGTVNQPVIQQFQDTRTANLIGQKISVYDDWDVATGYIVGDKVTYRPNLKAYVCLQPCTGEIPPDNVLATWSSTTAYGIGDDVIYSVDGRAYNCLVANTGFAPGYVYPDWDQYASYAFGANVFNKWDHKCYQCIDPAGCTGIQPPNIAYWSGEAQVVYWEFIPTASAYWDETDNPWTTVDVPGAAIEGLGVALSLPKGLYYADNDGTISENTVDLDIEYAKGPAYDTWVRYQAKNATANFTEARWSAGYYDFEGTWIEMEAGSTTPGDHVEGDIYTPSEWYYGESGGNGADDGSGNGEGGPGAGDGKGGY